MDGELPPGKLSSPLSVPPRSRYFADLPMPACRACFLLACCVACGEVNEAANHRQFGSPGSDWGTGIAVDGKGNVYVTGRSSPAWSAPDPSDGYLYFLRKYDERGSLLWSHSIEPLTTPVWGLAADGTGVFFAGEFIRKFDPSGAELWNQPPATEGKAYAHSAAVDGNGNLYVSGYTRRSNESTAQVEIVVSKLDGSGNELWSQQLGVRGEFATHITADESGNAYFAGVTPGPHSDVLIRKFDPNGATLWERQFGAADAQGPYGIAADGSGNVYVAGLSEASLSGAVPGQTSFVRSYDALGNVRWSQEFNWTRDDAIYSIAADSAGFVYVTGVAPSNSTWLPGTGDIFVRKSDASGNTLWTKTFGTEWHDEGRAIAVDERKIYVTGTTGGSLAAENAGETDAFLLRIDLK